MSGRPDAVNRNVHAKFIVTDDTVIITLANLTPTQFLYGPVKIEHYFRLKTRHNPQNQFRIDPGLASACFNMQL